MSNKNEYITIRLSKFYEELIDNYLEQHQKNGKLVGRRTSRANVVRMALDEFFKKKNGLQETQPTVPADLLKFSKEFIFAHITMRMTRGEELPSDHMDLNYLETYLTQLLQKQEIKKGIKIEDQQKEILVEELMKYHKQLLEMFAMMG